MNGAAVAGRGLARVLSYQIPPELRAGKLQVVLPEFEPPPDPDQGGVRRGAQRGGKGARLVDFALERLRSDKSLN